MCVSDEFFTVPAQVANRVFPPDGHIPFWVIHHF